MTSAEVIAAHRAAGRVFERQEDPHAGPVDAILDGEDRLAGGAVVQVAMGFALGASGDLAVAQLPEALGFFGAQPLMTDLSSGRVTIMRAPGQLLAGTHDHIKISSSWRVGLRRESRCCRRLLLRTHRRAPEREGEEGRVTCARDGKASVFGVCE